ncbi:pyrroline-5-carboxylate reductase [Palleronia sp. KMU-117]|uniref:pyrroline-5-carboxylate reductase n=1 Tax=Palleronia sp. KMU-117 TaxID=3434108 RepID=UPI003D758021
MSHTVLLFGAGNMGFAMMTGWLRQDPDLQVYVVEPDDGLRDRAARAGAWPVPAATQLPADTGIDLVVLAVKPDKVERVLSDCGLLARSGVAFLSVAAGVTLTQMAGCLPPKTPLIRCMPNTPAAVGLGMMVLCPGPEVDARSRALVGTLMATSGTVAWLADEGMMDAVTAISGSGPAYVFHFIEALTDAGVGLGLPADLAALLASQTVAGAGRMAQVSEEDPGRLRERVTSPGGTTAAALTKLMDGAALTRLIANATRAARDRSIELGKKG